MKLTAAEAIAELQKVDTIDMPARLCEAHYMAIEALKQYGALQEIRQEIESAQRKAKINGVLWSSMSTALNIVDKHIKEIEE